MTDDILRWAIAYKHENILTAEQLKHLQERVYPLEDSSSLNSFIIDVYGYASSNMQHKVMTDFLVATVEELSPGLHDRYPRWNVAETRSLVDMSIIHIFNRVIRVLENEGLIHADRYAKGVITEATLIRSKETIIYRLEGS